MEINCDFTYALGKTIEHGPFIAALPNLKIVILQFANCKRLPGWVITFNSINLCFGWLKPYFFNGK